jgi:lipid A 3-O-deacylase
VPALGADAGEAPPADWRGSEIQVFIENDSFGSTDQYYTNGIKIGGGVPAERLTKLFSVPPSALLNAISEGASNHLGLFFGQNLYTPRDITISAPQPYDRPWAAWLYLGAVAQRVKEDHLHTVEFDLGLVGPAALGEEVQTFWHKLVDAPKPQGWDNQIRTEPGFLVSYLHKRRFGNRSGVQIVPHAGASIGTIMTFARAGAIVRLGQHMTGFGPDGIEPGGAMLKNTRREGEHGGRDPYEWFVFGGIDGRAVAHNIFVDGSLFRSGPGVDGRSFVYDFTAGLSVRIDKIRFSITRVKRSEEFATPLGGGGSQRFHSINIGIEF